jgi:hypothetical protein
MFIFGFNVKPKKAGAVSYDADASAFFTATGITDTTQKSAVNQLVLDLKSYNIWTKMKAVYPIVGGTATTHKYNLINPADTDAAFRLTFATGWTHSSTGMVPNGTSAYADTFLNPSTQLTLNNTHLSYYSRTNILESSNAEMGSYSGSGGNAFYLLFGRTGNLAYSFQYEQLTSTNFVTATGQSNSTGFWMGNRTSNVATTHKLWRNGVSLGNATTTAGAFLSNTIWIGGINNSLGSPPAAYYTKKQCAFASIGAGLTDTEAANFYTAVQAYQTTLSRNV